MYRQALLTLALVPCLFFSISARECHHDNHLEKYSSDLRISRTETPIGFKHLQRRDVPKNPLRLYLDYRYIWNDLFGGVTNGSDAIWGNYAEAMGNISMKLSILETWFGYILNVTAPVVGIISTLS